MFFYASKLFAMLLFPFPLFLLMSAGILFAGSKSRFRFIYGGVLLLVIVLSSNSGSGFLLELLEQRHPHRLPGDIPRADAIVVLGGMTNPLTGYNERPEFLSSADRILTGEELLRLKKAPRLLISGGSGLLSQRGEREARILKRWLLSRGHNTGKILIEPDSRNTAENAIRTAAIARSHGWRRVILVTSAFHMPRSVLCFEQVGLRVIPFPVDYYSVRIFPGPEALMPTPEGLGQSTMVLKELIGMIAYRIKGYI